MDITRVVEHRKKCIPKKVATPKERRSISLPDLDCGSVTDASLPHSGNTCPEPKLPADVKSIPPPKPWSKPASPHPSWARPLNRHPDIKLSGAHSNNQIYTNKATPPTLKSPSKSTPGELDGYDYVDMQIGNDQSSTIVEKNTAKSKRHGYMSESAPHIHKQSESKIRRSNSDVSSRGSVSRKGTIKVYKDPQHTISTQRQLSVEDLTTMHVLSK